MKYFRELISDLISHTSSFPIFLYFLTLISKYRIFTTIAMIMNDKDL